MLELIIEMLKGITMAGVQALAETWLLLVVIIIIGIIAIALTKPWKFKSMRAWLRSLEK